MLFSFQIPIIPSTYAIDIDGTANLDMSINSSVDPSSIIGTNFILNLTLSNAASSESDAFNPGFIITLPPDVVFVSSSDLGSPIRREVLADGSTLLFFETDGFIPGGTSENYNINLSSNTSATLFTPTDIEVLAYAEDNIYGVWAPPSGSPAWTLPWWYDYAGSTSDPTDPDFPDNVVNTTDLSTLPFFPSTTQFLPYDIEKIWPWELLIWEVGTTTLRITWNNLGPLNDFEIVDVIPNSRKFIGFTSTASAITSIAYDTPSAGQVTLTISNIDVPTGWVVDIQYETLWLAFEASSYSGSTVLLNTNAIINDQTPSVNTAAQQVIGTWDDGTGPISITPASVISPQDATAVLSFWVLEKSVNNRNPVIGDTIRYTVSYDVAQNVAYDSNNSWTRIEDLLPDGLSFVSLVSSTNSGWWDALSLTTNSTNADGDTTLIWSLWTGDTIQAGDFLTIRYDVLVDGLYEGAWDIHYENTQSITNNAQFFGNIIDSGNNEEWWFTDPSWIGTEDTDSADATITAPEPTNLKQLVRVEFPDGSIYDSGNPLPAGTWIPVGSRLDFNISMDFPNVFSTGAMLLDALPLVTGPNTATYNIAFQTNNSLQDLDGNSVPINDDNADGVADTSINGQTLWGTTPAATSWIAATPANSLEFDIWGWSSAKTFSIWFSVDVLPIAPSGWARATLPVKNVLLWTFSDDIGAINTLWLLNEEFIIWFPIIEIQKDVDPDPTTDIAFGDSVDYNVVIQNTGDAAGYLENIIDTLPANMSLDSSSAVYGWSSATPVPGLSVVQSGATLEIDFNTVAPLGRSFLDIDDTTTTNIDESTIILSYTLSPTVDFVIVWGESRTNTIWLDYYSTDDAPSNDLNKIDEIEDDASFTVASPTITRTYISTSEADSPDNQPGWRPDIYAGEESIFETTITLPPGTYTNTRFTESLLTSRLTFLTWSVISTGTDLSFSTGTGFTANRVDFWDIVNSGNGDQTIVIQTTARGWNDTTRRNNNRARGDFRYSGQTISRNTPVDLIIPTLNVTKDVSPTSADTSDPVTYTIEIEHTSNSNARAYDVLLKDVLPPNVSYVAWSLSWNGNFIGTEADLFSGSWILLPDLADGDRETLTFDATIWTGATAGTQERNNTDIAYSTLDDDNSPVEANYTAANFADLDIKDIDITHYITATNNPDTWSGQFNGTYDDLTIWEELTYNIDIDTPALLYSGAIVTQTLPAEFTFLTGSILTDGVWSHTIETIVIWPDNVITFTFWDIDNTWVWAGAWFLLETQVVVNDVPANNAGDTINSVAEISYDSGNTKSDNSPNFDIVEPNVTITKVFSPDTWDGWDAIPTTITISNTGTSPLYDISWSDTLPPKSTWWSWYLGSSSTGVLLPGDTISYTYDTILDNTVVYGEMLTGTASVLWDSMPWVEDEQRGYSADASDIITITGITGLQKDLTSSGSATVWDIKSYIVRVPISEWVTDNITINDIIPAGLDIIPGSINITSSWWVSHSGTIVPNIGAFSLWSTKTVEYIIDDIVNSDSNNSITEYITITYDVVVLNTSDANAGDMIAADVVVDYNSGATILDDGPVPIEIVEPDVSIDLASTYTFWNDVVYIYTLENSGTSTAYDLNIDSILPAGLSYSGAISITNSGGVVGLVQSGEDFTIEELPVNTWNPLQFTIAGVIDATVADMTNLSVDADLTYTGQDDAYTSVITNPDNTERTGTNIWENDYLDTDPDTITVLLPILNESISVVDLNGWVGIINDTFEYTITLTNSGSVDLTDISALLDIPASFTGFTIISTPTGSTDNSTATWGIHSTGQVDISDIDLLIGQSVTIVYQVTALDTTPSPTTENSEVIISDSPEWAIWWNPNVDVTIYAPDIQLSKSIIATDFSDPTIPLDTITYELVVENTGDVTLYNILIDDPMLWWDITSSCSFSWTWATLNPTESAICNPANYPLTTSDIIRWYVENSAEVTSEDESMNPVEDISDAWVWNEATETVSGTGATDSDPTNDPTVQLLTQEPELKVIKTIIATDFNIPNLVWDTISYQITIENTGNLNITNITLSDPLFGGDITSTCTFPIDSTTGLDIWETATCTPPDYVIDANDIIRGYVDNNAVANGTDALGDPVDDTSDPWDETTETSSWDGTTTDGDPTNDPTTIEIIWEPELTVTKTISSDTLSTPTASWDTITYSITIFNSWQLPVDTITLNDPHLGWDITTSCDFPISSSAGLEVGESASCTPSPYVVQESDIVRWYIDNNATANWLDPFDDSVIDTSDPWDETTETSSWDGTTTDGNPTNDPTTQSLIQGPAWEIQKTSDSNPLKVWDTLIYNFEIENTGNITINTPTISDVKCSTGPTLTSSSDIWSDGKLSPNEIWEYSCTSIPITQEEVDDGKVDNTVTANSDTVLWDLPEIDAELSIPVTPTPNWEIEKTALSIPLQAEDTIEYRFRVTNTWNVSISWITVSDIKCAATPVFDTSSDINSDGLLFQDEIWTYTCTSIPVTQIEADAAQVLNTVNATGTSASWSLGNISDNISTPVGPTPNWELLKTTDSSPKFAEDTLEYDFSLQNTGNVTISAITLSDAKCSVGPTLDLSSDINSDSLLSPSEIWTYSCTSIPVTQEEVDLGEVINIASATGTPAQGELDDAESIVNTAIPDLPSWSIEKTTNSSPEFAGDTLNYFFSLQNTGNVTISSITLTDAKCSVGPTLNPSSDTNSDSLLSPDEVWNYDCISVPVTQDEVNAGEVINSVEAQGTPSRGGLPNTLDSITRDIPYLPSIELYKWWIANDINNDGLLLLWEEILYNFTLVNTGNIALTNVTISDPLITINSGPISLDVWETNTDISWVYTLNFDDSTRWYVENSAIVTAESIWGDIEDTSDTNTDRSWVGIPNSDLIDTPRGDGTTLDWDPNNDYTVIAFNDGFINSASSGWWGANTPTPAQPEDNNEENTQDKQVSNSSSSTSSSSSSSSSSTSSSSSWDSRSPNDDQVSIEVLPSLDNKTELLEKNTIPEDTKTPPINTSPIISEAEKARIQQQAKNIISDYNEKVLGLENLFAEERKAWKSFLTAVPKVLPQTGTPISERISTRENSLIDTQLPSNDVFRLAGSTQENLEHWQQVLPLEDRSSESYIIIPSNGLVMPINNVPEGSGDYSKMISGREIEVNNYLKSWALEYPGSSTNDYGEVGNKVIFGHSSYFKNDNGRYKTHFQKIIELDIGEQIWVYKRQENNEYKRFIYVTQKSYDTSANNTSVLDPGIGKNLTLFTCTPIGGIEWRWIIEAKYIDEALMKLQGDVEYEDISKNVKRRINSIIVAMKDLPSEKQEEVFYRMFLKVEELQIQFKDNAEILRILEYLQLQVSRQILLFSQ